MWQLVQAVLSTIRPRERKTKFQLPTPLWLYSHTWQLYTVLAIACLSVRFVSKGIACYSQTILDADLKIAQTLCLLDSGYYVNNSKPYLGYPGISPVGSASQNLHYVLYRFLLLALFFKFILFQIPQIIWLQSRSSVESTISSVKSVNLITESLVTKTSLFMHQNLNGNFVFCVLMTYGTALFTLLVMMVVWNQLLHGMFVWYGVAMFQKWCGIEPMVHSYEMFPNLIQCPYYHFGLSGSPQLTNIFCSLSFNFLMDKIFLFTWFYYCFLIITLGGSLLQLLLLTIPGLRKWYFKSLLDGAVKSRVKVGQISYPAVVFLHLASWNLDPQDLQWIMLGYLKESIRNEPIEMSLLGPSDRKCDSCSRIHGTNGTKVEN